jgi:predicted nucleic-acid-binding protein
LIALDTNVLVRYLTQDDAAQASKAAKLIDHASPTSLFLSNIVLCEMVWVLDSRYGFTESEISDVLEEILQTSQFSFEDKAMLWEAANEYRTGKGDFSDYLIARIGHASGCSETVTFDRALKGHGSFRML